MAVPVRAFSGALSRLSGVLDEPQREQLMRAMATRVVEAAGRLPVWVVSDDDEVCKWAVGLGVKVNSCGEPGLSAAAQRAVVELANFDVVAVVHADLAIVDTLDGVVETVGKGRCVIVPDYRDDGSNIVCVPTGVGFRFQYGPGSFERHIAEAERLGLEVAVVREEKLMFDLDTPDDLALLSRDQQRALRLGPVGLGS